MDGATPLVDDEAAMHAAAMKLQAVQRGKKGRAEFQEKQENRRRSEAALAREVRRTAWESGDRTRNRRWEVWRDLSGKLRRRSFGVVVSLVYLIGGTLLYHYLEDSWSYVDSLYFMFVTMSTVGYGDLHPSPTPGRRLVTVFTILFGVIFVFGYVSDAVGVFTRPFVLRMRRRLERWLPQKTIDLDGSGDEEFIFRIPRHPLIFWLKNLAPDILVSAALQLGSAAIFRAIEPGWFLGDALYHCMVTATTVGYGDVPITTSGGKLWACVHILLSVAMIGETIESIDELRTERRAALARAAQLRRHLDKRMLKDLLEIAMRLRPDVERDGEGLTELEFVLAMVIELGMLQWDQVRPFIKQVHRGPLRHPPRPSLRNPLPPSPTFTPLHPPTHTHPRLAHASRTLRSSHTHKHACRPRPSERGSSARSTSTGRGGSASTTSI